MKSEHIIMSIDFHAFEIGSETVTLEYFSRAKNNVFYKLAINRHLKTSFLSGSLI